VFGSESNNVLQDCILQSASAAKKLLSWWQAQHKDLVVVQPLAAAV
jgi:hypothetical protein